MIFQPLDDRTHTPRATQAGSTFTFTPLFDWLIFRNEIAMIGFIIDVNKSAITISTTIICQQKLFFIGEPYSMAHALESKG